MTAASYKHSEVPCPHCGKPLAESIEKLLEVDQVKHRHCGNNIDLKAPGLRAKIEKEAELYRQIKPTKDFGGVQV